MKSYNSYFSLWDCLLCYFTGCEDKYEFPYEFPIEPVKDNISNLSPDQPALTVSVKYSIMPGGIVLEHSNN